MLCTVHVIVELACLVHVYHVLNYTLHVDNGYLCVRPGFCRILCLSEEKPVKSEQDKMVEKPVSTRRCMPHWAGFMKRRRERHTECTTELVLSLAIVSYLRCSFLVLSTLSRLLGVHVMCECYFVSVHVHSVHKSMATSNHDKLCS